MAKLLDVKCDDNIIIKNDNNIISNDCLFLDGPLTLATCHYIDRIVTILI